ncbi:F-box domain protein [Cordyceps fumosorosea ARSEF 2679]|uniref:F-box domain protein n=1 Tax=Cordyceps fumosorosea (strain ARSEF 2679) TaxID=1081104 RepID=A0A168EBI9_CORFA|nr:F-box domain protein [Cordyceps fumosorosea ARSEF 2679]OAA73613.1 F-box domain protein [Cordyceps fumosorosea ARSEF 2679]
MAPPDDMHGHVDGSSAGPAAETRIRLGHLPEELLLRIVEFVYGPDVELEQAYLLADRHAVFHALALVDRRFRRLATPLLYRVFATSENPFRERQRARKTALFLRALRDNPALREHVRGLCLYTAEGRDKYPSTELFAQVRELVTLVPETAFLHVNGGFDDFRTETLEIVGTAIVSMKRLRHLSLNRQGYGPTLEDVVREFRRSLDIRRLSLNGVTAMMRVTGPIIHEKVHHAPLPRFTSHNLPASSPLYSHGPQEYRTASFTHLTLKDYSEDWAATAQLLSWPRALHSFEFGNFRNNRNDMDLCMFGNALLQHRDTLTALDLGFLRRRSSADAGEAATMIDVSLFPALRELTLSRWSFRSTDLAFTGETGRRLLAPRLRRFTWSFGIGFMESERLSDMGPNEEAWLRDFGNYAAERRRRGGEACDGGCLRTIYVRYLPIRVLGEQGSAEYPWDRLRRVADDLAPRGIELLYSDPKWSREDWQECVKAWEDWT